MLPWLSVELLVGFFFHFVSRFKKEGEASLPPKKKGKKELKKGSLDVFFSLPSCSFSLRYATTD